MSGGGVSVVSGGGFDADAILAGGQAFTDRLQQFRDTKAMLDQALADLALGKDARAAMDEAARQLDAARAEAEQIRQQALEKATKTQRDLNEFSANVMAEQKRAMEAAQAAELEANQKLADAKAILA